MNYGKTKLTVAIATALGTLALAPGVVHADAHEDDMRTERDDRALSVQLKDARLEGMIETTFLLNDHISPFSLEVEVREQIAYLDGIVRTEADKELARILALAVDGVKAVESDIVVDPAVVIEIDLKDERWADTVSDATITAAIKSKLLWNRHTDGLSIDVDTKDGVVRLTGEADSEAASQLAEQLARDTRDVTAVKNELVVNPDKVSLGETVQGAAVEAGEAMSDAWITSKVKWSFLLSDGVDATDVNVDTKDGKVTISGAAATATERELMRRIAENVKGVRDVNVDNVKVDPSTV